MTDRRILVLSHSEARQRAVAAVQSAPHGYRITIEPAKRTDGQNERFHAICGDRAAVGREASDRGRVEGAARLRPCHRDPGRLRDGAGS